MSKTPVSQRRSRIRREGGSPDTSPPARGRRGGVGGSGDGSVEDAARRLEDGEIDATGTNPMGSPNRRGSVWAATRGQTDSFGGSELHGGEEGMDTGADWRFPQGGWMTDQPDAASTPARHGGGTHDVYRTGGTVRVPSPVSFSGGRPIRRAGGRTLPATPAASHSFSFQKYLEFLEQFDRSAFGLIPPDSGELRDISSSFKGFLEFLRFINEDAKGDVSDLIARIKKNSPHVLGDIILVISKTPGISIEAEGEGLLREFLDNYYSAANIIKKGDSQFQLARSIDEHFFESFKRSISINADILPRFKGLLEQESYPGFLALFAEDVVVKLIALNRAEKSNVRYEAEKVRQLEEKLSDLQVRLDSVRRSAEFAQSGVEAEAEIAVKGARKNFADAVDVVKTVRDSKQEAVAFWQSAKEKADGEVAKLKEERDFLEAEVERQKAEIMGIVEVVQRVLQSREGIDEGTRNLLTRFTAMDLSQSDFRDFDLGAAVDFLNTSFTQIFEEEAGLKAKVESLEAELAAVKDKEGDQIDEIGRLQSELRSKARLIEGLSKLKEEFRSELSALGAQPVVAGGDGKSEALEDFAAFLRSKMEEFKQLAEQYKGERDGLLIDLDARNSKLARLEGVEESFKQAEAELARKTQELNSVGRDREADLEEFERQIDELNRQKQVFDAKERDLKKAHQLELNKLQAKLDEARSTLATSQSESVELRRKSVAAVASAETVARLEAEMDELRTNHGDALRTLREEKDAEIARLGDKVRELNSQVKEIADRYAALEEELGQSKSRVEELERDAAEREENVERLREELTVAQAAANLDESSDLAAEMADASASSSDGESEEFERLRAEVERLKNELATAVAARDGFSDAFDVERDLLRRAGIERDAAKAASATADDTAAQLKAANARLTERATALEAQVIEIAEKFAVLEEEKRGLEAQIADLNAAAAARGDMDAERDIRLEELNRQLANVVAERDEVRASAAALTAANATLTDRVTAADAAREAALREKADAATTTAQLRDANAALTARADGLAGQVTDLTAQLAAARAAAAEGRDGAAARVVDLEAQLAAVRSERDEAKAERDDAVAGRKSDNTKYKDFIDELSATAEATVKDKNAALTELRAENDRLTQRATTAEAKLAEVSAELAAARAAAASGEAGAAAQLAELERQFAAAKAERDEANDRAANAEARATAADESLAISEATVAELNAENNRLRDGYEDLAVKNEVLSRALNVANEDNKGLFAEIEGLVNDNAELGKMVGKRDGAIEDLEARLADDGMGEAAIHVPAEMADVAVQTEDVAPVPAATPSATPVSRHEEDDKGLEDYIEKAASRMFSISISNSSEAEVSKSQIRTLIRAIVGYSEGKKGMANCMAMIHLATVTEPTNARFVNVDPSEYDNKLKSKHGGQSLTDIAKAASDILKVSEFGENLFKDIANLIEPGGKFAPSSKVASPSATATGGGRYRSV